MVRYVSGRLERFLGFGEEGQDSCASESGTERVSNDSSIPSKPSFSFSRSTGSSSELEASFFTDCSFEPKRYLRADLSCSFSFVFSYSRDLRKLRFSSSMDCMSLSFSNISAWFLLERDSSSVRSSNTSFIARLSSSAFSKRSIRYSTNGSSFHRTYPHSG